MDKKSDARRGTKHVIVSAILLGLLIIGGFIFKAFDYDEPRVASVIPAPTITRATEPLPSSVAPTRTSNLCMDNSFAPRSVVLGHERYPVVALPWQNVDGALSAAWPADNDPDAFAWTEHSAEAAVCRGAMLLTAHTYPQGSEALGNYLLDNVDAGDNVSVTGANDSHMQYTVANRAEYSADSPPPKDIYRKGGAHRIYIIVCSGKRLSPGVWTHRTVWTLK